MAVYDMDNDYSQPVVIDHNVIIVSICKLQTVLYTLNEIGYYCVRFVLGMLRLLDILFCVNAYATHIESISYRYNYTV